MNEAPDSPDTLLLPSWVVTVDEADRVLPGHAVAVRDGIIAAILPCEEAQRRWPDAETVDLNGHALMPGLVNAHTHASMSLLRGLADDLPLMQWLQEHIWPTEGRWVDEAFLDRKSVV